MAADTEEEARTHFQQGVALYEQGGAPIQFELELEPGPDGLLAGPRCDSGSFCPPR